MQLKGLNPVARTLGLGMQEPFPWLTRIVGLLLIPKYSLAVRVMFFEPLGVLCNRKDLKSGKEEQ
jgi:hypothetical protein